MSDSETIILCDNCSSKVKGDDKFCVDCGVLFDEDLKCHSHSQCDAEGVCVICSKPFCTECILNVDGVFLCNDHSEFEIFQGMARVLGSNNYAQIELIKSEMLLAGLHPIIYSRKHTQLEPGSGGNSSFLAPGNLNGHLIHECDLMVRFPEVLKAIEILRESVLSK